ncbi:TatD family hydrolase [Planctomycetota bacterium]
MELIDTHCHLTFEQIAGDLDSVLLRSRQAGVDGWIVVGTNAAENPKVVTLAQEYDNMYAAVGIHPHYAKDVTDETMAELKELAQNEKVVAIGETGLDFHYNFSVQPLQKQVFAKHLKIAIEMNKPVIVHSREAFDETVEILDQYNSKIEKIVFHCFSGSVEQAKIILDKGYYISFTGVVTFKNAQAIREAAKLVPIEKMMVETDCPFMSPAPMRKQKVNEPALMVHTARLLAEIKETSLEDFAKKVTATSRKFFGIG